MIQVFESVPSTQDVVKSQVLAGSALPIFVQAMHQSAGRGRFDRKWISPSAESLSLSFVLPGWLGHESPWLAGMWAAAQAASALHLRLQWPNDLVISDRKVGGVLTELIHDDSGRPLPVIGIGLNLNQAYFEHELGDRATSLRIARGREFDATELGQNMALSLVSASVPQSWADLEPHWRLFDQTPGKKYRLASGAVVDAIGLGPGGELIGSLDGETVSVHAADAIFGGHA